MIRYLVTAASLLVVAVGVVLFLAAQYAHTEREHVVQSDAGLEARKVEDDTQVETSLPESTPQGVVAVVTQTAEVAEAPAPVRESPDAESQARLKEQIQRLKERKLQPASRDELDRERIPATDPLPRLDRLSDAELTAMLRVEDGANFSQAALIGQVIGEKVPAGEWIAWFENAGPSAGLRGEVAVAVMRWAFFRGEPARQASAASRMLALIDGYLGAWKDQPVNTSAFTQLTTMLQRLAPVAGGLELIRRWLVETPHGNEIVEKGLYAALVYWPFREAGAVAREALLTFSAGPINGAVECWGQVKRRTMNPAWSEEDMLSLLPTLVDCIKRTPSPAALLLASALAGRDLLLDHCLEIGWALLARTDSRVCSAMGFHFFTHVDLSLACSTWRDWFHSRDENQIAVACIAAPHLRDHVIGETERDRILALAMDEARSPATRASAAEALCQVEVGFVRSRDVLKSWVVRPELDDTMLQALGRMAAMGTKAVVEATLQEVINDASRTPKERHYALFLLATRNPMHALDICERQIAAASRSFDPESLLLAAATVEAMLPDQTYKRTAAVRAAIPEPVPQWITELRLRRGTKRAEHKIVSYAWSSSPTRK